MLNVQERKTIIIALLSLFVAVVTYGLLYSTGTFETATYNLGGAIVGFLATVYILKKVYEAETGQKLELKGASYFSEDTLKIVDFRSRKQLTEDEKLSKPESKVIEIEHYKLRKLTDSPRIIFKYATTGFGMEGQCITHPHDYEWADITQTGVGTGEDSHLKKRYEMRLNLEHLAKKEATYVRNRITFINAFQGKEKEWFHTHIDIPTPSITIVLLFSDDKPCKKIKGLYKVGRQPFVEIAFGNEPIRFQDEKIVYWRIDGPKLGVAYQLEWEW
jgi:hypothetical protein